MIEQQADGRWDAILRMLESVAALDFSRRLTISDKADSIDALASGLNMLSEELEANLTERKRAEDRELSGQLERIERDLGPPDRWHGHLSTVRR